MLLSRANLLTQYLAQYASAPPWSWATANCCHFVSRWVQTVTGRDPMEGLAQTPTARAAVRLTRQLGGLAEAWTERMGSAPIPPAHAQLGDVLLLPAPAGTGGVGAIMGICCGRTAVIRAELGLVHLPVLQASMAWRVVAC